MKRNLYFRTVIRRQNVLKNFLLDGFLSLASWPRLILEVFIRHNFGERYFSLASAVTVAALIFLFPLIVHKISSFVGNAGSFWGHYATWYVFLLGFLYFAWQRWQEVKHRPSVFDFSKFSLYAGDIHPAFYKIKIVGKRQAIRTIETLLEPAAFFVLGLVLMLVGQKVGILLLVCSIFYSLSYCAAYKNGDNFILDKIDEIIMNEELTNALVHDLDAEYTRGVRFHMKKPTAKALRKKVAESFVENDQNYPDEGETMAA